MTTETTTALTAPEPAQPPDLKKVRPPKLLLDEAMVVLKQLKLPPKCIEEHEARKVYGRYAAEGIHAAGITLGMETIGTLDATIANLNKLAATAKNKTHILEAAKRLAECSKVKMESIDFVQKWSREVATSNPAPPPSLRLNGAPTLNVNINTKGRDEEEDEDAIEVNSLAKSEPAV